MPWCPHCNEEFREGITTCCDCGTALIDEPPQSDTQETATLPDVPVEPCLLISTDSMQARMIMALLKQAGIPFYTKNKGVGGYLSVYMGYSVYGTNIYVNKSDSLAAKELIDACFSAPEGGEADGADDGEPVEEETELTDGENTRSYTIRKRVMVLFILLPLAVYLFSEFVRMILRLLRLFHVF